MAEASKDLKPNLKPLPPIQQAVEVTYEGRPGTDPFRAKLEPDKKSGCLPDANRRKGASGGFSAGVLKNGGVLIKPASPTPLSRLTRPCIRSGLGNYLRQNYGQITAISESEITLKELVEGCRWRMDRTYQHAATAGTGASGGEK